MKLHLEEKGTEKEKEVAKSWSPIALFYKFGLGSKEVRRRVEGLSGAIDCFKYKFVDESSADAAGAGCKNKKAKTGKGSAFVGKAPEVDGRDEKARKKSGGSGAGEGEGDDDGAGFQQKPKRPPPQVTGYRLFSKDVIGDVKTKNPDMTTQEIIKVIKRMYAELEAEKREGYEKNAQEMRARQAARRGEGAGNEENEAPADENSNHEPEKAEEEEKTIWRTDGSDYIGKRLRRYVFDARNKLIDAADGVVVGWLDKEESDYLAEGTGEPAPLWHMTYDDARIGSEDLEEHEIVEAMELLGQELPEKVQARYQKRLEVIAVQQAKKKEKEEKAKAREEAKMLKALQQMEKEAQKKEREKLREKLGEAGASVGCMVSNVKIDEKKVLESVKDEADLLIETGKWKGIRAGRVEVPAGSKEVFPSAALSDDFISIYTFLHDLSAPLGAAKMQLEDVLGCLGSPSTDDDEGAEGEDNGSVESFYEVAKWLTELASRSFWINDGDEEMLEEVRNRDVCDVALAAGPLLSMTAADGTVKYSCWQLLNEASWPEIARMILTRRIEVMPEEPLVDLRDALGCVEPSELSVEQKLKMLRFLCDEAAAGDRVGRVLNDKLKQIDRILDKKRSEDFALRSKGGAAKKTVKAKVAAAAPTDKEAGETVEAAGEEGDAEGGVGAGLARPGMPGAGRPEGSRTCFDVMMFLADKDPANTFEVRHKGNTYVGTIDRSGVAPRIVCNGRDYDTPTQWIKDTTDMKRFACKLMVHHKGEKLKTLEEKLDFGDESKSKSGVQNQNSEVDALMSEVRDESMMNIDVERRKREIQTALKRAQKGLRYDPIGFDRWHRSYWCLDGITDRVWVRSGALKGTQKTAGALLALAPVQHALVAGCWASGTDFGFDGQKTERFKKLGKEAEAASDWVVYYKNDGTLQALVDVLKSGPNGKRESALILAMREHGVLEGLVGFESGENGKVECTASPGLRDAANGDADVQGGQGRSLRLKGEADECKEQEDGFEWNELPSIGDLVWARMGEGNKRAWHPVVVIEPPVGTDIDDAQTESDDDEEEADEWQKTGSEFIGKRVLIEVAEKRGTARVQAANIVGWLPKDLSDFKDPITQEPAALWHVKFDDKRLGGQDLEEYEVKDGILRSLREEAKKKSDASEILSSRSMFGQTIKKVYVKLFNEDEDTAMMPLGDLQPFQQFREQHEQDLRRAGKTKILQQVKLANVYLDEHGSQTDKEQDVTDLLRKLGLVNRTHQASDTSVEFKAALQHCAHFPRILNVVQDHRDAIPWITTTRELKVQVAAISVKLLLSAQMHDKLAKKIASCKSKAESVHARSELIDCLIELEQVLHEAALEKESGDLEAHVDLDEWRTEGHEFIGKRIRRPIKGAFGRVIKMSEAKIVGWLSKEESDYKNEAGEPAALWHILWNDGQEEDLEEWEVQESLQMSGIEDEELVDEAAGIWGSGRDRKEWHSLMSTCRTVGAAALGIYLLGDRALPMVAELCQDLLTEADESGR